MEVQEVVAIPPSSSRKFQNKIPLIAGPQNKFGPGNYFDLQSRGKLYLLGHI